MHEVAQNWRMVAGFSNYLVSSDGQVKGVERLVPMNRPGWTFRREKSRLMRQRVDRCGYCKVAVVSDDKKQKGMLVHRLVAMAFVEGYESGLVVNHKNGIKTDNRAENLEWVTLYQNTRHSIEVLGKHLSGEQSPNAILTSEIAIQIADRINRLRESPKIVGSEFGISGTHASQIANGRTWSIATNIKYEYDEQRANHRGTHNWAAKMSDDLVREIRKRHADGGVSYASLGREFGITAEAASYICRRRTWKHVK